MSKAISIPTIANAISKGFGEAQRQYEEWSGGDWLWRAPEYSITTMVAKNIFELEGVKYITLENGSRDVLDAAGARGRGR
uniref:Uncharacterized protein n=1 Tax=Candidatus Kentrum sp. LFY TaxID=2126342 RepID=A0A450USM5_9GAMM|nr:MAG: hypothetical protein BECKLFY1418B_GA0070995_107119 [Candidatus Kentron sp. LFY]